MNTVRTKQIQKSAFLRESSPTFRHQGCDRVGGARLINLSAQHVAGLLLLVDLFDLGHDK